MLLLLPIGTKYSVSLATTAYSIVILCLLFYIVYEHIILNKI